MKHFDRRNLLMRIPLLIMLLSFCSTFSFGQVVDNQITGGTNYNGTFVGYTNAQGFTVTVSGTLSSIVIPIRSIGVSGDGFVRIRSGSGTGGSVLYTSASQTIATPNSDYTFPLNLSVTVGDVLTWEFAISSGDNIQVKYSNVGSGGRGYGGGTPCPTCDYNYTTYVTVATPGISTSGSLTAFTACSGTASSYQTFTVSGSSLSSNLVVTAPTDFEVSTSSGSGYGASVSLSPSSGTVGSTTIYARIKSSASVGTPSGNITCASTGATTQNVAASGTVNSLPSAPTSGGDITVTYDGSVHTGSATPGGGESIVWYDAASNGSVSSAPSLTNVGSVTRYAAAKNDITLCESATRTAVTVTITAAALSISADNVTKTYGDVLTGGSGSTAFTSSGLQNSETIGSVTIAYGTGSAGTDAVGSYTGQVTPSAATGGTFNASNYQITYQPGAITVNARDLYVRADDFNKLFGDVLTGSSSSTSFSSTGLQNGETIGTITISFGNGAAATDPFGNYPHQVFASGATGGTFNPGNYSITYVKGYINISQRPLTITANNVTKTYGDVLTGGSGSTAFTSSGLQNSETIGSVTIAYGTGSAGAAPVGTYTGQVTPSAATGGSFTAFNYSITYVTGDITVNPRALIITANDKAKCQGATYNFDGSEFVATGLVNSDAVSSVTLTCSASGNGGTNAGSPYAITPSAAVGSGLSNYSITYTNGAFTVWANPSAGFTINDADQCLSGNVFTFTDTSVAGSGTINSWSWTTPGGTNATESGAGPVSTTYGVYGLKTVNLTVTDDNNCSHSTSYTSNVTVYQHPTAAYTLSESSIIPNDNVICTGATVNFNGTSSVPGWGSSSLTYQWYRDGSVAPGGSTSATYSPVVNGITNPDEFDYHLVVTNNRGCNSLYNGYTTNTIYVHPYPVPSITTPDIGAQGPYGTLANNGNGGQLLCHGKVIFANNSTIPSGSIVTYTWNFGDGSGTTVTTNTDNVKHEFPVNNNINWFDAGFPNTRYTISIVAVSNIGCSTSTSINRDIKNGPDAIIGMDDPTTQNITGNSFLFENNSQNRHPSFITNSLWNWGDGSTSTNTTHIPKVYAASGSYRVHLINYTNTGCTDTAYLDLNVTPNASASFTYTPNSCANRNVAFTSTSVLASGWLWNFGDGNTSTAENPTHTYAADGSYTVTLTVNGAIVSSPQTVVVATTPTGVAINAPSLSSCGNQYTFTSSATGYLLSYAWTFSGGTGGSTTSSSATRSYVGVGSETADLVVTSNGVCSASASQYSFTSVAAASAPVADVSVTALDYCSTSRTVNNSSTGATSFEVKLDAGSFNIESTFPYTISGLSTGAHTLILKAIDGSCESYDTVVFNVSTATAAFTSTPAACGTNVAFSSASSIASYGTLSYSWDFNSGEGSSAAANPGFNFASSGSKPVSLTVTASSGCSNTATSSVSVSALAGGTASFTVANAAGSCNNGRVFTNTSTGSGNSYLWNFGDGSTSSVVSPSKWYGAAGTYTVTLTLTNGSCSSTASTTVTINGTTGGPAASFNIVSNDTQALASNKFDFFNTSQHLGFGWNTTYSWDFGDATSSSQTHIYQKSYASEGTYLVTLTATSSLGCTATFSKYVTVNTSGSGGGGGGGGGGSSPCAADASFIESNGLTTQSFSGNSFNFFNTTTHNGFGWVTNSYWNFGDASTSANTHVYGKTYASPGTYNVRLVVLSSTGCYDTAYMTVTVSASATASFTYVDNSCSNRDVAFTSTSTGATSWLWNFGDGQTSTSENPTHTYAANGSYTVTLTINGSVASSPSTVVVATTPTAGTIGSALSSCGNVYTYSVSGASGQDLTYAWGFTNLFGTGATTGSSVTRTYSVSAPEGVTLTVTSAGRCSAAATPYPLMVLAATTTANGVLTITASDACSGTRTIDNTGSTGATSYEVKVDGGAFVVKSSFPYDITGLSAGAHTVVLKSTDGVCTDYDTATFIIGSVTANFSYSSSSCGPTVTFTNSSSATYGTPTYSWNFNSEGTSTLTSPSYTFSSGGTKSVALTATLANGCSATYTNASVSATSGSGAPVAGFSWSMVTGGACNTGIQFTSTSTGATSYTWNYGDGTVSIPTSTTSIFHAYSATGTFTVTLTASNACGTSASVSQNVVVTATGYPKPEAAFNTDNVTQCVTGNRYDFFNRTALNGFGWVPNYYWDFGDGTHDYTNTFAYGKTYALAGSYQVSLVAVSNYGCRDTARLTVVVLPTGSCTPGMIKYHKDDMAKPALNDNTASPAATGIGQMSDVTELVTLFPNPNQGTFTIGLGGIESRSYEVVLVDMVGREVYREHFAGNGAQELTLSNLTLATGTYSMILKTDKDQTAHKNFVLVR